MIVWTDRYTDRQTDQQTDRQTKFTDTTYVYVGLAQARPNNYSCFK